MKLAHPKKIWVPNQMSPSPDTIITILSDRNYMEDLYSRFLVLRQMQALKRQN
jgi:hypothetical protein